MVIDFHTHTFPAKIAAKAVENMSRGSGLIYEKGITPEALCAQRQETGVDLCVNLPVMTSVAQVEKINSAMIDGQEAFALMGILPFGGMHPDYPHPREELHRLRLAGIRGIKIHPAYQGADLDDLRYLRILDAASAEGLVVVTHTGLDLGFPTRNYATVPMILRVLRAVQPERLVLAHMGCLGSWDAFLAEVAGAPVYLDTAFSLGPIRYRPDLAMPHLLETALDAESFVRLVRRHGADKVLFATDSPWGNGRYYRDFVSGTALTEAEQQQLFHLNAEALLGLT